MARKTADFDEADGPDPFAPVWTARPEGHEAAEKTVLAALASERMHHAWLISGPRGIGKATLAYAFARSVLKSAAPAAPSLLGDAPFAVGRLGIEADDPLFHRTAVGGHGNLLVIERGYDEKKKAQRGEIVVEDIRRLHDFFARTAAEPGWRVAIIDSADEMNRNAANALLKVLEEPPRKALLLLVAHAPGRLLPTIRSRCRRLPLLPLADDAVAAIVEARLPELSREDIRALSILADGAPGRAILLGLKDGLSVQRSLIALLNSLPGLDIPLAHSIAQKLGGRANEDDYRLFVTLLRDFIGSLTRARAAGEMPREAMAGEAAIKEKLAATLGLDQWVELWEKTGQMIARADAVHLDRKQVILNLLLMMDSAARGHPTA